MLWLIIVIIAHLFYALVFVIDKYILSRTLPHPIVYAFYVGILSILIWVLIPFGFRFPLPKEVILSLLAAITQISAWILFYKSLNQGEVSRIVPFIGSFTAIFTLILSSLFIKEFLTTQQVLGFILLVSGGLVISITKDKSLKSFIRSFIRGSFGLAFLVSLLSAIFWVITKYIFINADFVSGIVWTKTAVALVALTLIISRKNRKLIFRKTEEIKPKTVGTFISARVFGVLAGLFVYLAVFLGSVTLVNSLQGLQYVFILILAFLLFRRFPNLREQLGKEIIFQKIIAIILIALGLVILVV